MTMSAKNRIYAHLLPEDVLVWEDYLTTTTDNYDALEYDVRVGRGKEPPAHIEGNLRSMALDLTKKRIDVVGSNKDAITIIEITRIGDIKSIGQLMVYPVLYKLTFNIALPLKRLLICRRLDSDILPVLREHKIDFVTV